MSAIPLAPVRASTAASRIDTVFLFELFVSLFFVALIFTFIIYFVVRYRRRSEDEIPPDIGKHYSLEAAWTIIPFGIMVVMFFWGARIYVDLKQPLNHGLEIHVIGKQWMWKIEHPDGVREINELHVPVGEPVKLIMTSQDVIHDFFLPEFRVKQDVLPGSFVTEWFTATRPGTYHIFCAQYCGTDHAKMVGKVVVMLPADYQAWRAGEIPAESPAAAGAKLFTTYGCSNCHGQLAPTLAGLFGRTVTLQDGSNVKVDEEYLRKSIEDPSSQIVAGYPIIMPSFKGQLTQEQMLQIISYIKSLATVRNTSTTLPAPLNAPSTQPAPGDQPRVIPNHPPAESPYPITPTPFGK
jgi:cytochrome c oxidase subunit 2